MPNKAFKSIFEAELLDELYQIKSISLPANSVLLESGSYIKVIPVVISGKIKVIKKSESDKEILLYHISAAESCILSITASFNNQKSKVYALTETDAEIIAVPALKIKEWMHKYSSWRTFLMKLYNERLVELLSIVDEVAFKHIDFRLIERLKEKAENDNKEIKITHQQLADELGTAREVVSRLLKKLESQGKIKIYRGKIKIIDVL
jgi:CRP/FNR family transcriptional regulator